MVELRNLNGGFSEIVDVDLLTDAAIVSATNVFPNNERIDWNQTQVEAARFLNSQIIQEYLIAGTDNEVVNPGDYRNDHSKLSQHYRERIHEHFSKPDGHILVLKDIGLAFERQGFEPHFFRAED